MNWEALTAMSTALTGLVIAATAIAGFVQIRQLREQRRDSATVELVRTFLDGEFVRAFDVVMSAPEGLSAEKLRERGSEYLGAVRTVAIRFEMVGALPPPDRIVQRYRRGLRRSHRRGLAPLEGPRRGPATRTKPSAGYGMVRVAGGAV
jgi:hypothetical protein